MAILGLKSITEHLLDLALLLILNRSLLLQDHLQILHHLTLTADFTLVSLTSTTTVVALY